MKNSENQQSPDKIWGITNVTNLVRHVPSGRYYARFRLSGKLKWRSLNTDKKTVAKTRLPDEIKKAQREAAIGILPGKDKILVEDAIKAYRDKGFRPDKPRTAKDKKPLKPAAFAYYEQRIESMLKTWPALAKTEIAKIKEEDCNTWADKARKQLSPSAFNHTLGALRNIIEFGIRRGVRHDNPASSIIRESETPKEINLPEQPQFEAFLAEIKNGGGGFSRHCANLVRFMAYSGLRKGEAAYVTWKDCNFEQGLVTVRGHPETGLKNRKPGEFRIVPMIPEMRQLLQNLRASRQDEPASAYIMEVRECQKAMDRAAKVVGMERITHHDLRHLFATRCIESGVDIPTVANWLGHKDRGALAMKVYGHLRAEHSVAMAQTVTFSQSKPANLVQLAEVSMEAGQANG